LQPRRRREAAWTEYDAANPGTIRQLIDTLQSTANLPAAEQCSLIEQTISDWRADRPQLDDMTMVGIQVG
jgi:serine phosphatase RsbU (regulator of sigma subunit)